MLPAARDSKARASQIGPTSCATSAAPWIAGDAAITRNGCSERQRREQIGGRLGQQRAQPADLAPLPEAVRRQRDRAGEDRIEQPRGVAQPFDHGADRAARGAERPPELALLRGRIAHDVQPLPGQRQAERRIRPWRLALDVRA
jgi:hypothetical protein